MQSVVEEGSAGRVIGSDRFRRDWTKEGSSAVVLSKRLDSWALSLIRIVRKVEVCGTW